MDVLRRHVAQLDEHGGEDEAVGRQNEADRRQQRHVERPPLQQTTGHRGSDVMGGHDTASEWRHGGTTVQRANDVTREPRYSERVTLQRRLHVISTVATQRICTACSLHADICILRMVRVKVLHFSLQAVVVWTHK